MEKLLVTRLTSSMTHRDHVETRIHKPNSLSEAMREKGKRNPWCIPQSDLHPDNADDLFSVGDSHHVELDEPSSKDGERPDEANGHEHAEQDVVQNHGDKFPLLCRLRDEMRLWGKGTMVFGSDSGRSIQ